MAPWEPDPGVRAGIWPGDRKIGIFRVREGQKMTPKMGVKKPPTSTS